MDPLLNLNTNLHLVKQVLLQRQLEFIQFLPLFLEPEGMFPPEVVIINSTAVRVIWTSPSNPNGVVTGYSVYVNNQQYKTGMSEPGSFLLADLSPFTVYEIQVRISFVVCVAYFNFTYLLFLGFPRRMLSHKFLCIHKHIFALMLVCIPIQGMHFFLAYFRLCTLFITKITILSFFKVSELYLLSPKCSVLQH